MSNAQGIHAHEAYKLGKADAVKDERNLKYASVAQSKDSLPEAYDFDDAHPGTPIPMFANNTFGCCVIAGRAHQTLRFERSEEGVAGTIDDEDVISEYFKETRGTDTGLDVLGALKKWRSRGWKVGDTIHRIHAFAEVDFRDHDEMRHAIYADIGLGMGLKMPKSAQGQFIGKQTWTIVDGPEGEPGSWGGHYVYVTGYTKDGLTCISWGRKQSMTWDWLDRYCDEAFAIFDLRGKFKQAMVSDPHIRSYIASLDA